MKRLRENEPEDPKDKPSTPLNSDDEESFGYLGGEELSQEGFVDHTDLLNQEAKRRLEAQGFSDDEIEDKLNKPKKT